MLKLALIGALALACSTAYADDLAQIDVPCGPVSAMRDAGKYRRLSHDEFVAARVMFFLSPDTPANLPPGDAALIREREDGSGSIVYLDGGDACAPMKVTKEGIALLRRVGKGEITHAAGRM